MDKVAGIEHEGAWGLISKNRSDEWVYEIWLRGKSKSPFE